jgi:hypothetical protein
MDLLLIGRHRAARHVISQHLYPRLRAKAIRFACFIIENCLAMHRSDRQMRAIRNAQHWPISRVAANQYQLFSSTTVE